VDRPSRSVAAAAPDSPHEQQTVEPLIHLIYASSAVGTPDAAALARVLGDSRRAGRWRARLADTPTAA
jgi:hypothetical protein